MTNKTKGKLPGDSYKLWVDIAALFYDCTYKVREIDVKLFDKDNKEIGSLKEKMLLVAMGASGGRTYGSQQKILPGEHNVCGIKQMSVFRKLAVKKLVEKGTHSNAPETVFYNAQRIEVTGNNPVLAQMDGETILLQKEDFPVMMELTAPVIPVLKRI
jgi:diacylglycerol kinase family enzyme